MGSDNPDIIAYWISRSDETMKEASLLFDNDFYNATINRLYYSAFYAVSALLLQYNHYSKSHSGLKTLFNLHFIKSGSLMKNLEILSMNCSNTGKMRITVH